MHGGEHIAGVLERHRVRHLFTLCGGHIAPILVAAKRRGIQIVDVRHEATAVFAADATSRLTGTVGVAAVTAGPGVTNAITALENARLAQSPLVLLGGATATVLKGRGALQDIDQLTLVWPHVKWAVTVSRVRDLAPTLERAFLVAASGVPGPVFVEIPVDLLYDEALVRSWYGAKSQPAGGGGAGEPRQPARPLGERALQLYLDWHLERLFAPASRPAPSGAPESPPAPLPDGRDARRAAELLQAAARPVLILGSQVMLHSVPPAELVRAIERLGVPTYLSGMARGLLPAGHPLLLRHQRREALRQSDLVALLGVPADFRLDYGRHLPRRAKVIGANRSREDLVKNRRPTVGAIADPGRFLLQVAELASGGDRFAPWLAELRARDQAREADIDRRAAVWATAAVDGRRGVDPLAVCRAIDRALGPESVLVGDGGDFVATASYSVSPRAPLSWLDPGVFGTLGVGAGFALAAKAACPQAEVWLLWGDGAAGYGLAELDTCVRVGLPVIAVVGNDAGWTQIAREQVEILGDDVGTVLLPTAYHEVARGLGAEGLVLGPDDDPAAVFAEAKRMVAAGRPVLVNVLLGKTDFRKGSISM
jgi:acetolactate synthase-like protein